MKKLFFGATMAMSLIGFSQESYFSFSAGYGLGFPGNQESEADYGVSSPNGANVITIKAKTINIGGGLNVNLSYGVPLSRNLHLDLGVAYQNNLGSDLVDTSPGSKTVNTYDSWSTKFAPSLRFKGDCEKIVPFAQIGPQLILASITQTYDQKSSSGSLLRETKYAPNLSVGGFATLGAELEVSENIWLFTSLSASLGYYSPTSSEVVTYKVDGVDMLDQLEVYQREREYEKEVTYYNSTPTNPNEPSKFLRTRIDYSAVSLNIGLRVVL